MSAALFQAYLPILFLSASSQSEEAWNETLLTPERSFEPVAEDSHELDERIDIADCAEQPFIRLENIQGLEIPTVSCDFTDQQSSRHVDFAVPDQLVAAIQAGTDPG
ncbi:unnamed protein product [Gongylonema pulchrum]|uniref:TonB-dependent receptor n=1 Tax=Gongylonema pulchrum TaxID=637853 RepID=A0A183DIF6_9BILA|nr:unnamed protein product [Gongylonema pulchrum]